MCLVAVARTDGERRQILWARLGVLRGLAIILAMEARPLAEVKDHLSEFVEQVARERARVTITRNGRPAAVLISPEDLESLEETLAILGDSSELAALREGINDLNEGLVDDLDQLKGKART